MALEEDVAARIALANGQVVNEKFASRRARVTVLMKVFEDLDTVRGEVADYKRLSKRARGDDAVSVDGDRSFDLVRAEMAARAAGRALRSAMVGILAALKMSRAEDVPTSELVKGLAQEDREEFVKMLEVWL